MINGEGDYDQAEPKLGLRISQVSDLAWAIKGICYPQIIYSRLQTENDQAAIVEMQRLAFKAAGIVDQIDATIYHRVFGGDDE